MAERLTAEHLKTGRAAERIARTRLEHRGLKFLCSNYHCRFGELDLIMRDRECVVFVEVRYRKNSQFGGGVGSVDQRKQRKIVRTAEYFLLCNPQLRDVACRFDVIAATGNTLQPDLNWIRNAF